MDCLGQVAFRIVSSVPEPIASVPLQSLTEGFLRKEPSRRPTLAEALSSPPLVAVVQAVHRSLPPQALGDGEG